MATNIIYDDTAKEVIFAVGADYSSGDYIADGGKGGISLNDVASGDDAVVAARCVVEGYAKAAGETWDDGDLLYFDAASNEFTTTEQADGLYRAKAYRAALLAATTGDVEIIDPIPDDIFEASEIHYDNSTSALAATNVQDAIDEVDDNLDNLTGIAGTLGDNARNSTDTTQSLTDSTATDIALEDVEVAGDVTVDVTNKEFTIPTTGLYALAFSLTFATAAGGTNRIAEIIVNGSVAAGGEETPSGTGPDVVTDYTILFLTAADVVKLSGWQDSGGALDVTAGRLAIQRIQ